MTFPPSSATTQRMGRMNRGPYARPIHRSRPRNLPTACGRNSSRNFDAAGLRSTCVAATYSPFGVFTIASFETGIPCFSAKLSPRVWLAALSNATDFGGPVTSRLTSSCFRRTHAQWPPAAAELRKFRFDPLRVEQPFVDKYFSSIALSSVAAFGIIPAGISSQPISKENHRNAVCATFPCVLHARASQVPAAISTIR